jgi:hypothetical protein
VVVDGDQQPHVTPSFFHRGNLFWSHGLTQAEMGPPNLQKTGSFGNYYLEITNHSSDTVVMRSYHLDANTNNESVSLAQVEWFRVLSSKLSKEAPAPALLFVHIPMKEYDTALRDASIPLSGHANEAVSYNGNASGNAILTPF